jgi:hypothetical protein
LTMRMPRETWVFHRGPLCCRPKTFRYKREYFPFCLSPV